MSGPGAAVTGPAGAAGPGSRRRLTARQLTGWALLAIAVAGALGVAALAVVNGRGDPLLAVIAAIAVLSGTLLVAADARYERVRRAAAGRTGPGRHPGR